MRAERRHAMNEINSASPQIDERIVDDIRIAAERTLSQMFNLPVTVGELEYSTSCVVSGDVSGVVNLRRVDVEGALITSFPKTTIMQIMSSLYKKEFTSIDSPVLAGAGEITNIMFGVLKSQLSSKGFNFKMAVPYVVLGRDHKIFNRGWTLKIPCQCAAGPFFILLTRYPEDEHAA